MTNGFSVLLESLLDADFLRQQLAWAIEDYNKAHIDWQNAATVDETLKALDRKKEAWARRMSISDKLKSESFR